MKIYGGLVTIKKLAFANSYRTVVGQKPQFPPLFRSGNTCANCGVSFGKWSLLFSKGGDSVCAHMHALHTRANTMAARRNMFTRAPFDPRRAMFRREAVHLEDPGSETRPTCWSDSYTCEANGDTSSLAQHPALQSARTAFDFVVYLKWLRDHQSKTFVWSFCQNHKWRV